MSNFSSLIKKLFHKTKKEPDTIEINRVISHAGHNRESDHIQLVEERNSEKDSLTKGDSESQKKEQEYPAKEHVSDEMSETGNDYLNDDGSAIESVPEKEIPLFIRFQVDVEKYGFVEIPSMPISNRLKNVLLRNGYQTLRDFLKLSESDIASIKHSGQTTVNDALEIAIRLASGEWDPQEKVSDIAEEDSHIRYCDRYNVDSELYDQLSIEDVNMPNRLRSRLAVKGCLSIGQFLRLTPSEIREIPGAGKGTVQAAEETISKLCKGQDLVENGIIPCKKQKVSKTEEADIRYCDRYNVDSTLYDRILIENINMPNRLRSRLILKGCTTIGDLLRMTPNEIREIPGAGRGTMALSMMSCSNGALSSVGGMSGSSRQIVSKTFLSALPQPAETFLCL